MKKLLITSGIILSSLFGYSQKWSDQPRTLTLNDSCLFLTSFYNAPASWASKVLTYYTLRGLLGANYWELTGNSVTGTPFLGTTNNFNLKFKQNNLIVAKFDSLENIKIGKYAAPVTTTAHHNIAIGDSADYSLATGKYNVSVGAVNMYQYYGDSNITIGSYNEFAGSGNKNNIVIGNHIDVSSNDNYMYLGNANQTNWWFGNSFNLKKSITYASTDTSTWKGFYYNPSSKEIRMRGILPFDSSTYAKKTWISSYCWSQLNTSAINACSPLKLTATSFEFNTGNVGVGISNPSYPLHVIGKSYISDTTEVAILDVFGKGSPGVDSVYAGRFMQGVNATIKLQEATTKYSALLVNTATDFKIKRRDTLYLTCKGGNVGIGTSSPTNRLTIGGSGGADNFIFNDLTANQFVKTNGSKYLTSVATITASSDITGILPVGNGGTGATTLTGILLGNGTSAFTGIASGTPNQVLTTDGSNGYSFQNTIITFGVGVDSSMCIDNGIKIPIGYTNKSFTIDTIFVIMTATGLSSPSIVPKYYFGTDISATGTAIITSPGAVTSKSTVTKISSFNNATINKGNMIWLIFDTITTEPRNVVFQILGHAI